MSKSPHCRTNSRAKTLLWPPHDRLYLRRSEAQSSETQVGKEPSKGFHVAKSTLRDQIIVRRRLLKQPPCQERAAHPWHAPTCGRNMQRFDIAMAKSRSRGLLSRRRCEAVVQCTSSKTKTGLLSSNQLSPGTSATRWLPPATPAKASWELSTSSSSRSPLQRSPRTDLKDRRTAPRSGDADNASGHQGNHSASRASTRRPSKTF